VLVRLSVAAALGAAVGIEREFRDQEAGIRTHLLVALGSALFTIVSAYGFHEFGGSVDPTRIAAQIVTGIGFLGAGAIIREGLSVRGLTTAGSLWIVAAVGMASGAGFWWAAVIATALTLLSLGPLRFIAYRTLGRLKPADNRLIVELKEAQPLGPLLDQLDGVTHIEVNDEQDRRTVHLEVKSADERLVARLCELPYVIGARWRR
jgi:putative Mg2+ transporter-C (MgtC) family protein